MNDKGFESEINLKETPNFKMSEEKPLNNKDKKTKRVDINILKARAQQVQNSENRKNISIFVFTLAILGGLGIYFSI